ncbi:MAG: 50S ribosomal protein L22 [Euryarchaeota archaeon]|nr:50S ribosomal protein L22 [Euryarchaeota archaeon]
MVGYTQYTDPDTTARAIGKEIPISPRKSREVCRMVRGKDVDVALRMLEEVVELKRPVSFPRRDAGAAHKKGIGPGRYPEKCARAISRVIESAIHNAEYKGLDTDNLKIKVITANLGRTIPGYMPRAHGRSTPWNQQTVNIEVILEEVQ